MCRLRSTEVGEWAFPADELQEIKRGFKFKEAGAGQ
jgi:hypothetical protein